jgi:hypothetical protein
VVEDNVEELRQLLHSPPQTNEVGRSAVLLGGLLHVTAETGLPIRLLEVGASAGLNLHVDAFRFQLSPKVGFGPVDSPLVLRTPWLDGGWPPTDAAPVIGDRAGCDADPIDPRSTEGWLRLAAYVWPDQPDRFERLRAGMAVAAATDTAVERATGADFLERELCAVHPGVVTVVWHSIVWQYVTPVERTRIQRVLAAAGSRATTAAPLAHLSLEPRRVDGTSRFAFLATLRIWPEGRERVLGEAGGHGPPVRWA